MNKKLLIILFFAFLFRLIALNQSLWLDEGTTAKVVLKYGFTQIISGFSINDFHPPLYYLFMKLWTNIFGYSEIVLRMPSVLFSLLTGYLVYLLGKKIKDEKTGLLAAMFFLFNPLIVYYSQEARMYMMVTFLLTLSLYYFFQIVIARIPTLRRKTKQSTLIRLPRSLRSLAMTNYSTILFGIFISLSFATFYGSVFLIIPMLLYLLYKKQYKEFITSFLIFAFCFLLLLPLLLQQFSHSRESLIAVANWKSVLGIVSLKNLLMIPLKFAFGRISFYPKIFYYFIAGLWSIVVWFFVLKGALKNKPFFYLLICSLSIGLLFSLSSPLLQYFRFLYLIPIMSILLSYGVLDQPRFHLVGGTLVTGFVLLSLIYLLFPQFHREDWKSMAGSLNPVTPIYMIKSSSDVLIYYRQDIPILELRNANPTAQEIIVIPYTSDIYDYNYKNNLTRIGYTNSKSVSFRELTLEYWKK